MCDRLQKRNQKGKGLRHLLSHHINQCQCWKHRSFKVVFDVRTPFYLSKKMWDSHILRKVAIFRHPTPIIPQMLAAQHTDYCGNYQCAPEQMHTIQEYMHILNHYQISKITLALIPDLSFLCCKNTPRTFLEANYVYFGPDFLAWIPSSVLCAPGQQFSITITLRSRPSYV